ncbi:type II toxin-antitoxin system RelE/ParE family toxin [Longispora sp. NPDC051575]|uniref:type II toxin-antitoxin system RelE family toxin n=1 Tax=Longispora sp. NPDC051575 TaxID=3154943 RepID=UPI00343270D7
MSSHIPEHGTHEPSAPLRIELDPEAARQLRKLDRATRTRIGTKIDGLSVNPRPAGCTPLVSDPRLLRLRVGDWRIVYMINNGSLTVLVVAIAHRDSVYRTKS